MKHMIFALLAGIILSAAPAVKQAGAQVMDADIKKAEHYLQTLGTAQAEFIQTSSLGSRLSGTFYLNRPGRLRFDYNEIDDFIVADGLFIYYYDSQLGQQSNAPIGQTLADFLLRSDLTLSGDLQVTRAYRNDGFHFITLQQSDNPAAGEIELVFSEVPYQLHKWSVRDAQGETTEVLLKNLKTGVSLKNSLFAYHDPKGRPAFNR